MILKKYSKNFILSVALITTAARIQAINLEDFKNYSYNFGKMTIKNIKDYTHPFAFSAFEMVKKHQTFIYCTLGVTALGIAAYKAFQDHRQYKTAQNRQQILKPREMPYHISQETYIQESYFDNPFASDKSIFLNVFTNNQFVEQVPITTENQTILVAYRSQHKEFIQSLSSFKRLLYWSYRH